MNADGIQHYIFDLYGTLVDIHTDEERPEFWEKLCVWFKDHGVIIAPEVLKQCYHNEFENHLKTLRMIAPMYEHPEVRLESVFRDLFFKRGVYPSDELIRETALYFRKESLEYIRLYPGAKELLEMLQKQGKVWLLSNAQTLFTIPELDTLGIKEYFDGIYISSECLCKKPDIHFYQALLDREGILPEEAVMIGNDDLCDIQGAKKAGLHTIYLHSNLSPEFHGSEADVVMRPLDLKKLCEVLRKTEQV